MEVTKLQIEKILNTLPIGYYCGKNICIKISENDQTFYNPVEDSITIGLRLLQRSISKLPENSDSENDIRCLLYHEVSHAILTPKMSMTNIINIFEDERIETLLANYYQGVDFKEFVKRVNNYNLDLQPQNVEEYFFEIVRFRKGPKKFTKRVAELIQKYSNINSFSTMTFMYRSAIEDLYRDIYDDFNQNELQNDYLENDQSKDIIQNESSDIISASEAKQFIENVTTLLDSKIEITNELQKIFASYRNQTKNTASAINSYSGKFDSRSVVRNDYKYFLQQNRDGHLHAFSKLHLNLFIDESGSFDSHDNDINALLKGLTKFEKISNNFSFTLISCGVGQRIREKHDRIQHSSGGTYLTSEIFDQYKKVQQTDAQNINILMYDGDACHSKKEYAMNFRAFDNDRCVVIVDPENAPYVRYCQRAKTIITSRYTQELFKNIFLALRMLIH